MWQGTFKLLRAEKSLKRDNLKLLESLMIPGIIEHKYAGPEDQADALDGALTGANIADYLTHESDKGPILNHLLKWYSDHHPNLKNPFYDGLKMTLGVCGLHDLYIEAIDYIHQKGSSLN